MFERLSLGVLPRKSSVGFRTRLDAWTPPHISTRALGLKHRLYSSSKVMANSQKPSKFRVIIVGGGIAGLALANSLQHANVDYIVLEKGDELDPQVGAGIGILPNAARILDQLGCFDDFDTLTVGMDTSASRRQDGSIIGSTTDTLQLMRMRTGYPVYFVDRQLLLHVLANHIQDPRRIRLGASVRSIEAGWNTVTANCSDGSTVTGDIIVGADGVHSPVRHEMWRHADEAGHGAIFQNDKQAMSAEYKCLFGISSGIRGMDQGQTDRTYAKDMSTLSYVGKAGRVFWFVFVKMDKVYYPPHIPKFSEADAEQLAQDIGFLAIREHSIVTVKHLYDSRITCRLVPIEEADYDRWSYGRIVCLGDSIHKGTPNLGAGASSAIESAATLSNQIVRLASEASCEPPEASTVTSAFQRYQQSRALRVGCAMKFTNALTRLQALKGTKEYVYTHYLAPLLDDFAADSFSDYTIGATKIDHLPIPPRSLKGTMPFNARQGWGFKESKRSRTIRALPLLLVAFASCIVSFSQQFEAIIPVRLPNNGPDSRNPLQRVSTLTEALYAIWLLEASRLNNKGTLAQCSILVGVAMQYLGIGAVGPLYFFLLYRHTPVEAFRAADNRLTDASYVSTIAPLLEGLGYLSRYLNCYPARLDGLPPVTGDIVLNLQPYILSLGQYLLMHTLLRSTIQHDRLWAVQNDVQWIRRTTCSLLLAFLCLRAHWILSMITQGGSALLLRLACGGAIEMSWNELCCTVGAVIWLALVLRDFRQAGMTALDWITATATILGIVVCLGPNFALIAGWQWREEILISRRDKNAVTHDEHRAQCDLVSVKV